MGKHDCFEKYDECSELLDELKSALFTLLDYKDDLELSYDEEVLNDLINETGKELERLGTICNEKIDDEQKTIERWLESQRA